MLLPELLDAVYDELRPKDLCQCTYVSRALNVTATPRLYDTVHVYNELTLHRLVDTLQRRGDLGRSVRKVIVYDFAVQMLESELFTTLQQLTPGVAYFDLPRGHTPITYQQPQETRAHAWPGLTHLPAAWQFVHDFMGIVPPWDGWRHVTSMTCLASDLATMQHENASQLPCLKSLSLLYRPDTGFDSPLYAILDCAHAMAPALMHLSVRLETLRLFTARIQGELPESEELVVPVPHLTSLAIDVMVLDKKMGNYLQKKYPCLGSLALRVVRDCVPHIDHGCLDLDQWPSLKSLDLDMSRISESLEQLLTMRFDTWYTASPVPLLCCMLGLPLDGRLPTRLQQIAWRTPMVQGNNLPKAFLIPFAFIEHVVDLCVSVVSGSRTRCWLGLCHHSDSDTEHNHDGIPAVFPRIQRLRLELAPPGLGPLYALLARFTRLTTLEIVGRVMLESPQSVNEFALNMPPDAEIHPFLRQLSFTSTRFSSAAVLQDLLNRCPSVVDLELVGVGFFATHTPIVIDTPDRAYSRVNSRNVTCVVRTENGTISRTCPSIRMDMAPPGAARNIAKTHIMTAEHDSTGTLVRGPCRTVWVQKLPRLIIGAQNEEMDPLAADRPVVPSTARTDDLYVALRCRSVYRHASQDLQFFTERPFCDFDYVHSNQ
ncbi:hypothetical protein BC940DRAFT_305469 [Gongronella butleri]|nr:hypothetical protein BC940DRAFT_305469 [Gongronella butleri]